MFRKFTANLKILIRPLMLDNVIDKSIHNNSLNLYVDIRNRFSVPKDQSFENN